jgi:hypothetical protein
MLLFKTFQIIRGSKHIEKVQSMRGNELIVRAKNGVKEIPVGITFKENVLKQLGIG